MKLCFLSAYKEISDQVKNIAKVKNVNIDIYEVALDNVAALIKKIEPLNYSVMITRGATINIAKKTTNIPIVSCNYTAYDVMYALYEAKKITKSNIIGLSMFSPVEIDLAKLGIIFNVKILQQVNYENQQQVYQIIKDMAGKGADTFIGGRIMANCCKELGYQHIFLNTSNATLSEAIENAIMIAKTQIDTKVRSECFAQIVNNSIQGILVTDDFTNVILCNPKAEKILSLDKNSILNKSINSLMPSIALNNVRNTDEVINISTIGSIKILTTTHPIFIGNEEHGAIIFLQNISEIQKWEEKIRSELYRKGLVVRYNFDNYIGISEDCVALKKKAQKMSESDRTILISGETGTGKEILAQSIHANSNRKKGPFVAVNCSVFPQNLLESELFGYEEGSFTGAKKGGRVGLFELAHNGTIFLDEIGELPGTVQAELLRVIEEKQIRKIGSNQYIYINVRIITATNRNLSEMVEAGIFRRDLFYRLNVLSLRTMPLRYRKDDIPVYLMHFFKSLGTPELYDDELVRHMNEYDWPGNVRELQNVCERIFLLKDEMPASDIFDDYKKEIMDSGSTVEDSDQIKLQIGKLSAMENDIIREVYRRTNKNTTKLSQILGISRTTAWKWLNDNDNKL